MTGTPPDGNDGTASRAAGRRTGTGSGRRAGTAMAPVLAAVVALALVAAAGVVGDPATGGAPGSDALAGGAGAGEAPAGAGPAGHADSAGPGGQAAPTPAFVVSLSADGDANVTLTLTYDLASDAERTAFASLRDDATAREELATRFRDDLAGVADAAENRTGREMAVRDPSVAVSTTDDNETGVVTLSAVWEGLAAVDGGRLVVTEPFASGYEPDRRFTVRGPDGYALSSATPSPADGGAGSATWAAGTPLDGFEVAFAPAGDATPSGSTDEGDRTGPGDDGSQLPVPGFGQGAAAVAALVASLLAARRRSG